MDKTQQILEALQMQPLSEEEKVSRHILGRLYGPIATSLESTRNGRKYNAELWDKALADDLFKEKIANKSLFLELGHPTDREETDMEKVCACIPEMPKIVDGDLYAYVDILDTRNGRLLKTLCDYGFVPGISSRGSGDIMSNDEVDPETFFLETWDIVQLPAVKKARLAMCESIDPETIKLRKALTESYDAASEEEKKEMKETLDQLDISLDLKEETVGQINIDDIEEFDPETENVLVEDADEEDIEEVADEAEEVEAEDVAEEEIPEEADNDEPTVKEMEEILLNTQELTGRQIEEIAVDAAQEVKEDDLTDDEIDTIEKVVVNEIPEKVANPEDNSEALKVIDAVKDDKENEQTEEDSVEDIEAESKVDEIPEADEESEEAEDNGMEDYIESLKELIRQKDLLESEVKSLKAEKTVSDAEAKGLKEELNKYKAGFARVSELAAKSTKFEKEVQALNEQLTQKENEIKSLQSKVVNSTKLTESVNAHETKVKSLTEKLDAMQKDLTVTETKLSEQKSQYSKKLTEAVSVAKAYRSKYEEAIDHYIEQRASMLGVRKTDITRRLKENYSLADVDAVCDELLDSPVHYSNSLFENLNQGAKVKFQESKTSRVSSVDGGYEIDESLLEFLK